VSLVLGVWLSGGPSSSRHTAVRSASHARACGSVVALDFSWIGAHNLHTFVASVLCNVCRSPPNFTTVLHIVTAKGYTECVKYLLDQGADLEAVDANGNTPLHLATGNGHIDIVELLLSRAASTFVHNTEGWFFFFLMISVLVVCMRNCF
jgi:Ankyrin repeats (3 copies)